MIKFHGLGALSHFKWRTTTPRYCIFQDMARMLPDFYFCFRAFMLTFIALALSACAQKAAGPNSAQLTASNTQQGQITPPQAGSKRDFVQNVGDIIYFTTDSSDLTPEARETLTKQVEWLNQHKKYTIKIEGHADERGTREYNIALGARRATAVRNFLSRSGVNARRIQTVSFGKERPVAVCNDISCWSQNRRAQTILNSRAGS